MNENLPQKYKENFFHKIFQKIKRIFKRNTEDKKEIFNTEVSEIKEDTNRKNMLNDLKVDPLDGNNELKIKDFLENLIVHPELLDYFSNDRLEIILQHYLQANEKKRAQLKKLNA